MRKYLIEVMTEKIDKYIEDKVYKKDGVDGLSDLCHSFLQYIERDYSENGV